MVSSDLEGARVLVMGLGAHGGGAATARYCAEAGARVTVTDLRTAEDLSAGVAALSDLSIRYVLGRHEADDFRQADVVIKNPAVRRSVPLLAEAKRIETDISLFLAEHRGPVLAVTGTKGKSTTASALQHILLARRPDARLGGNITVSPLTFLGELEPDTPVVLELSSFQLGDLLLTPLGKSGRLPPFAVSVITNLLPDHQDYYGSMDAYAADKALIFSGQDDESWCILSSGDAWSRSFAPPNARRVVRVTGEHGAGTLSPTRGEPPVALVPPDTCVAGAHMRENLLFAATAAYLFGVPEEEVRRRAASFPGVPHRLESVAVVDGVRYVNDSAATIVEATQAAVRSFADPVHLIAGGSDKGVSLEQFAQIGTEVRSLHLLAGSATERIVGILETAGVPYAGPFASLHEAVASASERARPQEVVLLSPGCASFGMFRNEFDRGDQFRRLVGERPEMIE